MDRHVVCDRGAGANDSGGNRSGEYRFHAQRGQRGGRGPTTGVIAAGDEVSAAIAAVFSAHGQGFQALSTQAAAFHTQLLQVLNAGAGSSASGEAANVAAFTANPAQTIQQDLQSLAVFSPVKDLTVRPLFGTRANGAARTGQAGERLAGLGL